MPSANFTELYSDGAILTKAQLSAMVDSIETFLNVTKIDGDNIQGGGIPTAALADQAATADKIAVAAVGAGLVGGGGTALALNIDTAAMEISANTLRIKDQGVATAKLADGAVTTVKIADGAVTLVKRAAPNLAISSGSGIVGISNTSPFLVAGTTAAVTSTGRPVRITFGGHSGGCSVSLFPASSSVTNFYVTITRNGYTAMVFVANIRYVGDPSVAIPWGPTFTFIDPSPAAGSNSYSAYCHTDQATATLGLTNMFMHVEEM